MAEKKKKKCLPHYGYDWFSGGACFGGGEVLAPLFGPWAAISTGPKPKPPKEDDGDHESETPAPTPSSGSSTPPAASAPAGSGAPAGVGGGAAGAGAAAESKKTPGLAALNSGLDRISSLLEDSRIFRQLLESSSRYAEVSQAVNGKWYLFLAPREHGGRDTADCYGPFHAENDAYNYVHRNFENPGSYRTDDNIPVPKKAPNGKPIIAPR